VTSGPTEPLPILPHQTRPRLLVRSVLTSFAFLLVAVPALAVAGGYFFRLTAISGYGRLLMTDLPWLVLGAALALVLALAALRLGGRWFTAMLAAGSFVVLAGAVVVWSQFAVLAERLGATYDVLRQASAPAPEGRGPDARIVFAEVAGQPLHAEVWRGAAPSPGADPTALRPGVLYIHGGAFTHGSPGLRPHLFATFADSGYAVADIEYRLAPPPRWRDARADVLCALGWFQSVATTYGVDPGRIVVMGDSAGGNLALVAGYSPQGIATPGDVVPSCAVTPVRPAGVIALYPTTDLAAVWADVRELSDEPPFPEVYIGGTPTEYPDRYEAASVSRLVQSGLPPTLVITGTNDLLVRVERIRDLVAQLHDSGSQVELVEVPFADHAFDGPINGFGAQLEETLLPAFMASLQAAG
jgi:acetyl esterase/lipase